jgi:RraA family protein
VSNIGFRVLKRKRQVSAVIVEKFRDIPVANVSDSMNRMTAGGPRIRPLHRKGGLCGPAVTVRTRPGDNLIVHMALNVAQAGDVLIVDAGGDLTNAILGERMLAYCVAKNFAGVVIDGAVRDLDYIKESAFPVFAAGVTHRGPYKDGPGEINVPIAIDGMVIEPGDLVIGDSDGILCVPFPEAEPVLARAIERHRHEVSTFGDIGKGDNDSAAYRAKLEKLGCTFEN